MSPAPEADARRLIDAALSDAGWQTQDRTAMNLAAGRGIAVREFKMASGHGVRRLPPVGRLSLDYLVGLCEKAGVVVKVKTAA